MSRIVFERGEYYEEPGRGKPLEDGRALFQAQLAHDLHAAQKHNENLKKKLLRRIAKDAVIGIVSILVGALFLWTLVTCVHWLWIHPLW